MKASRNAVYKVIDGERDYQDAMGPERTELGGGYGVSGSLVMLQEYLSRATKAWVDNPGDGPALEVVRKIAAIAVRCMEENGAYMRVK